MLRVKIFSFFVVCSILAVGIFGFFLIDTGGSHGIPHDCPIPFASGDCQILGGSVAMVWHYIAGLQNALLSTTPLETASLLLFLDLLFLFILFLLLPLPAPILLSASFNYAQKKRPEHYSFSRHEFLRWLILCRTGNKALFFLKRVL